MIDDELILEKYSRNAKQLHEKVEYKIYQAINYSERQESGKCQQLLRDIASKTQMHLKIKMAPLNATVRHYIQSLLFQSRNSYKPNQVIAKWKQLEEQSIFYRPYLKIGLNYEKMGDCDQAQYYYKKCLQKFDQNDHAYFLLGKLQLQRGNYDEGVISLKLGHQINQSNTSILQSLAKYYESKQRWSVAGKYYQQLLELQPNNQPVINKLSQMVEQNYNARQKIQQLIKLGQDKNQIKQNQRRQPIKQINKVEKQQRKEPKEKLAKDKEVVKSNPKEERISPLKNQMNQLQKKDSRSKQQSHKVYSIDKLQASERLVYEGMRRDINTNPSECDTYWKAIQFLTKNHLQDQLPDILEQLIRNSKRQAKIVNQICKSIESFSIKFPSNRKAMHLLSLLSQYNNKNIFVHLYQLYLSILKEDRQKVREASQTCILSLFVDETMRLRREDTKEMFQNYIFLMNKAVKCQNIDLLSLSDLCKTMIGFFEMSLNKTKIDYQDILSEMILLKDLVVSSKNNFISTIIYLQRMPDIHISNILIKEDTALVITDRRSLVKHLKTCSTIIIYPQSLAILGELIHSMRKRFHIFIVKLSDDHAEKAYIVNQCNDLKGRNPRIAITPNISYSSILSQLQSANQ